MSRQQRSIDAIPNCADKAGGDPPIAAGLIIKIERLRAELIEAATEIPALCTQPARRDDSSIRSDSRPGKPPRATDRTRVSGNRYRN